MCPQSLYQPFMSGPQAVQGVQQSARPGAKSPKHNGESFQWSPGLKRRFRRAARSTRRRIAALAGSGYYSVSVTVTSVSLVPHLGRWPSSRLRSRRNSLVYFRQSRHEPVAKCFADNGFASFQANLQDIRDTQVGLLLQRLQLTVEFRIDSAADSGMGGFVAPPGWWSWASFTLRVYHNNYPIVDSMSLPYLFTIVPFEADNLLRQDDILDSEHC